MSFPLWFNALPSGHTQGSRQGYLTPLGGGLPLPQALPGDPAPRGLGWWHLDLLKPQWWPHSSKPRWRQPHDLWITSGSFFSFLEEKRAFAARWCSHVGSTRSNSLLHFVFFSLNAWSWQYFCWYNPISVSSWLPLRLWIKFSVHIHTNLIKWWVFQPHPWCFL